MQTHFHIVAYRGSVGAGLSDVQIAAVQDGILTITNNNFLLPQRARIAWCFGFGTNMSRLRLNTPALRYVGLPSLIPINIGTTVPSPANIVDLTEKPTWVDYIDQVGIDASQTDALAQTMNAIVALAFSRKEPSPGQVYRVRATGTITASAGTWVNGTITMDQNLPQGRYEVVGMDCVGTNLIAARLVFPGAPFRPGVICRDAVGSVLPGLFATNVMGSFGFFDFPNLPTLDIYSNGANTSQQVFLDLVRVGTAPGYAPTLGV